MSEKIVENSSGDLEKVADLSPKPTIDNGESKDIRIIHADPNDGDIALNAFAGHDGEIILTPEAEKKLLRKIDLNLMPVRHKSAILDLRLIIISDALRCLWT
jgi:ACS family allantoate permease-like MFS transporter